jgi:CBS-domain-containing membrane protein
MTHERAEHLRKALEHATHAEAEFSASGFDERDATLAAEVTRTLSIARNMLEGIVRDIDRAAEL